MKTGSWMFAVKVAIGLVMALCVVTAAEMAWRTYGLTLALQSEVHYPPISAEAMSAKAAPLLQASSNAEPIYRLVQMQHVELQQKHQFIVAIAESARFTAVIGLVCVSLATILLIFVYYKLKQFSSSLSVELNRENAA